jgi:hypothetical protein
MDKVKKIEYYPIQEIAARHNFGIDLMVKDFHVTRLSEEGDLNLKGFTGLVAHYKDFSDKDRAVFINLNQRAKLLKKTEKHKIKHLLNK